MRVHLILVVLLSGPVGGCANVAMLNASNSIDGKADQKAGQAADNVDKPDTDKSTGLVRLAKDIEAHGESDTAIKLYQQTVALSGNAPDANVRLGEAYMRANRIKPAMDAYRAALVKDPDDNDALLGLGAALVQSGSVDEGLADLAKAAPNVGTAAAYNRLGVAQMMVGQFANAQASFEKGRALSPDDLDIATNLALAAALGGEAEKAAALAREIAQSPAAQDRHRRNLIIALGIIGRSRDEARTVAPPGLSQHELAALLKHAETIREASDPKVRAKALGMMRG
jgi:Flp pilus assembly protein TadD